MNDLVQRLSQGDHPVTIGGPKPSLSEFENRVKEMGYVFIKFTATRGGTDLGVRVDKGASDLSHANFAEGSGIAHDVPEDRFVVLGLVITKNLRLESADELR